MRAVSERNDHILDALTLCLTDIFKYRQGDFCHAAVFAVVMIQEMMVKFICQIAG